MKSLAINSALLLVSSLGSLFVVEVALRVVVPVPSQNHFDTDALVFDTAVGAHAFKPSSTSVMSNGYFEEEVKTDQYGYRDWTKNHKKKYGV